MKRIMILCAVLLFVVASYVSPPCRAADTLSLATGEPGDFFWVMGRKLSDIWGGRGIPTTVVETTDDRENLDHVANGKSDLALVSGFVLADYLEENRDAPIVTIASLWKDAVHIILRDKFVKTSSPADLDGRKLYLGPAGTPEEKTARRILEILDITPNKYAREVTEAQLLAVMTDFVRRDIDGTVLIGPVPDPMVTDIIDRTGNIMRLIPATPADAAKLSGAGLTVFLVTIPKETYPFQTDELTVLATGTYLVSRSDLPDDTARTLAAAVFENADAIAAYFPQGGMLVRDEAAAHPIAPLHPGLR